MKELHHEPDVIHNTDHHPGDRLNGDQGGVDGMGAPEPRHRERRNSRNKQYGGTHVQRHRSHEAGVLSIPEERVAHKGVNPIDEKSARKIGRAHV